ncbi:HNH endonuclease [Vibrio fluvialis]|uniref:HNH endonuclease n=1 Tax=Vibrio fluvialis TaxID=676 RepID=UPI001EEC3CF1|nr:HNH endonuclease [Vibrio fluvialis]MCG6348595.1 HNH endonuclease [Vibrio fluvialis]
MAIYNTASDSANTAVRAFLTKVGEYYLGHSFNTSTGTGKAIWLDIRDQHFASSCAYCGERHTNLQIEHLLMFNRTEYGLHHPGNIVPCCKYCNKRSKNSDNSYSDWETHLQLICEQRGELEMFSKRKAAILENYERYGYPKLNDNEKHAISVIASSLYENIKIESEKSLTMYKKLDEVFVKQAKKLANDK